jgi:hypothetical protein
MNKSFVVVSRRQIGVVIQLFRRPFLITRDFINLSHPENVMSYMNYEVPHYAIVSIFLLLQSQCESIKLPIEKITTQLSLYLSPLRES